MCGPSVIGHSTRPIRSVRHSWRPASAGPRQVNRETRAGDPYLTRSPPWATRPPMQTVTRAGTTAAVAVFVGLVTLGLRAQEPVRPVAGSTGPAPAPRATDAPARGGARLSRTTAAAGRSVGDQRRDCHGRRAGRGRAPAGGSRSARARRRPHQPRKPCQGHAGKRPSGAGAGGHAAVPRESAQRRSRHRAAHGAESQQLAACTSRDAARPSREWS